MGLVPVEKRPQKVLLPLPPCEGFSTKKQEVGLHQTLNLPASWSWTSTTQNCENQLLLLICNPVYVLCYRSLNRLRQPITSEKNLGKLFLWTSAPEGYCEAQDNSNEALSSETRWPQLNPVLPLTNLHLWTNYSNSRAQLLLPEKQI